MMLLIFSKGIADNGRVLAFVADTQLTKNDY